MRHTNLMTLFYYRLFFFKTRLFNSIEGSMFCLYYVFQMEELIDVHHALYGRLGVIQCLSFWNGIGQVSSDMNLIRELE